MAFSEEMRLKGLEVRRARKEAREAAKLARQQASMQEPALQPTVTPGPSANPINPPIPTGEIEFDGMTATECCDACNEKMCVISGIGICAHPLKGGLHTAQMSQPATVARYRRAKHMLAGQKLNLQNAGS